MTADELRAQYLASGPEASSRGQQQLDLIREVLAGEATWAEPPPRVVDGLLAAVAQDQTHPIDVVPAAKARWPVIAAAVGSIAAVAALAFATLSVLESETGTLLAMDGTELEPGASGEALVRPTESGYWIRLGVNGLPPAPENSYYEGWVWSDDGDGVSIGTFHLRGGDEPVILWSGVEMADYPSIWVTLQSEGEGPRASDLVVMTGRMPGLP